ncbi:MAG TPA: HD-GYP domain-containing protein, partial [Candidatus Sulfotelmatobacter sp.]|nr:HD-GYP domain-containing protein [Candidatus Sulfotelmatobacter sp.]
IIKTLARSGGPACGLGGEVELGPEERPLLAGPWLAFGLLPKAGAPGALLVARPPGAPAFGPGDQAVLRSTAALAEMGLGKARLLRGLTKIVFDTVNALAVAIEAKDPYTEGHVQRVTQYSLALGEELGLPEDQLQILQFGALLHDVGKIGVRAEILNKRGKLDPLELQEIRAHPLIGEHIIRDVDFLQPVREIVRYHQERYDGTGYPEGLQGEGIPLLARIIAVADAYDSMAADRPYRKSLGDGAAVRILREEAGRQFDPVVVKAFLRIVDTDPGAA